MNGIKRLSVIVLCLFFVSCTNNKDKAEVSQKNSQTRSIASTKQGRLKLQLIKRKRAKLLGEIKRATKGFRVPQVYLNRLPLNRQQAYIEMFVKNARDLQEIVHKKGKVALNERKVEEELNHLFFPKAYAQSEGVVCPNAAWVIRIRANSCNRSTWGFDPAQEPGVTEYIPERPIWNDSVLRCARVQGVVCPAAGWEIVEGEARLMCTTSGSTQSCLNSYGSNRNRIDDMREACRPNNPDQTLSIASNMDCNQFREAEQNYIRMFEDNCRGASGVVERMCDNIAGAVEAIQQEVVNATEPDPEDTLPDTESCRMISGRHMQDAVEGEGMSEHWSALMHISRNACGHREGPDALAQNRYGTCSQAFPSPRGNYDINNLTTDFDTNNPTAIMNFVQQFGYTPSQYEALLCRNQNGHVDSPGEFRARLDNRLDQYATQSKLELIRRISRMSDFNGVNLHTYFSGQNRSKYRPMAEWFGDLYGRVSRRIQTDGDDPATLEREINNNSTMVQDARDFISGLRSQIAGNTPIGNFDRLLSAFMNNQGDRYSGSTANRFRYAVLLQMRDMMVPTDLNNQVEAAENWFASCKNEIGTENDPGYSEATGERRVTLDSNARCEYRRVEDPESFGYFHNGDDPYIIMSNSNNQCLQAVTVQRNASGDCTGTTPGYGIEQQTQTDPRSGQTDTGYMVTVQPPGRTDCSTSNTLDLTSRANFPAGGNRGFSIFQYDCGLEWNAQNREDEEDTRQPTEPAGGISI